MNTYEIFYLQNNEKNKVCICAKNETEAGKEFSKKYPKVKKNSIIGLKNLDDESRKNILEYVGAIVGIIIARYYWFDTIEIYGWQMFWESLFKGQIDKDDFSIIVNSSTFIKTLIAAAVGGGVGIILEMLRKRMNI